MNDRFSSCTYFVPTLIYFFDFFIGRQTSLYAIIKRKNKKKRVQNENMIRCGCVKNVLIRGLSLFLSFLSLSLSVSLSLLSLSLFLKIHSLGIGMQMNTVLFVVEQRWKNDRGKEKKKKIPNGFP